jgi:hypothetical protein
MPEGATYVFDQGSYSYAELTALRLAIASDFSSLRRDFGVRALGLDPVANRVELAIHPYTDAIAAALVARYGPRVRVVATAP